MVARGNERRAIFAGSVDRERFLEIAELVARRYRVRFLTYCLMTNHYHLLVQTPLANLAHAMRQLNGVYAQDFNRRRGRDGHLFQGRYGARLVQADDHLAATIRYIVRNPIRAALCKTVEEWQWSSHAAASGLSPPGFLEVDRLLGYLGDTKADGRARYLELVAGDDEPPALVHPLVVGDTDFVTRALAIVPSDPEYPRRALRAPRPPLTDIVSDVADEAAVTRAHVEHSYSMREIATHLGCGVATVHRRIRSHETAERGRPDPVGRRGAASERRPYTGPAGR